jgi:hypothetical protein
VSSGSSDSNFLDSALRTDIYFSSGTLRKRDMHVFQIDAGEVVPLAFHDDLPVSGLPPPIAKTNRGGGSKRDYRTRQKDWRIIGLDTSGRKRFLGQRSADWITAEIVPALEIRTGECQPKLR